MASRLIGDSHHWSSRLRHPPLRDLFDPDGKAGRKIISSAGICTPLCVGKFEVGSAASWQYRRPSLACRSAAFVRIDGNLNGRFPGCARGYLRRLVPRPVRHAGVFDVFNLRVWGHRALVFETASWFNIGGSSQICTLGTVAGRLYSERAEATASSAAGLIVLCTPSSCSSVRMSPIDRWLAQTVPSPEPFIPWPRLRLSAHRIAINWAGVKTQAYECVFQLAYIIARNAGHQVAIDRNIALEHKNRATRSGEQHIAFIELCVAQGQGGDDTNTGLERRWHNRNGLGQAITGRATRDDVGG